MTQRNRENRDAILAIHSQGPCIKSAGDFISFQTCPENRRFVFHPPKTHETMISKSCFFSLSPEILSGHSPNQNCALGLEVGYVMTPVS